MPSESPEPIKAFISYSWTSPTHESWVLTLATRLRQDGVNAILDKWDLQHGHDALKFMEQMVTDPAVTKVIMICDRVYTEKANKREGGVGAESQIISPELYGKATQNKFAAIITELDDSDKAYVPVFFKGRIYFDFSSDEKYEEQYEALLRWLVGKPLHLKPKLGSVPRHIADGRQHSSTTESRFRRALSSIRQGSADASGLYRDFSDALISDFESLRLYGSGVEDFDDKIIESIEQARPYVDQVFSLVFAFARFSGSPENFDNYVRTLERLAEFMYPPENSRGYTTWDFDNYKFLCHEIFLGTVAILLNEERFDLAVRVIAHPYLIKSETRDRATHSIEVFRPFIESLENRNRRLGLNRYSLHADMLEQSNKGRSPGYVDFMQADFVLFLRESMATLKGNLRAEWYPVTLAYATGRFRPFDVFARSESKSYFKKLSALFGVAGIADFKETLELVLKSRDLHQQFRGLGRQSISLLSNAKNIGSLE